MSGTKVSMDIPVPEWQCGISKPGLAWLLQGAEPQTRLSPRYRLSELHTPDSEEMRQLMAAGLLDSPEPDSPALTAPGREITATLSSPLANITLRIWDSKAGVESCAYFPGNPTGGGGVLLNEEPGGGWSLAGLIDVDILAATASRLIPAETEEWIAELSFEAHLLAANAAVLCAVFDIGRTAYRRQGFPDTGLEAGTALSAGEIAGYLDAQWGMSDFDKLITYLPATAMRGEPPLRAEIDSAVAGLASDGFLKESLTGRFVIGEPLRKLIPALFGMRSGLQWQRVSLLPGDETAVSHRVFLVGPGGAVLMFSPTASDHVYMKLTSGDEIAQFLSSEVAAILPPPEIAGEAVPECSVCRIPLRKGARFCVHCGKEFIENKNRLKKPDACHHCGKAVRSGANFCTCCGHVTSVP